MMWKLQTPILKKMVFHIFKILAILQIHGVSECIIMGTPMTVGTGTFKLMQKYEKKPILKQNLPIFERPELGLTI